MANLGSLPAGAPHNDTERSTVQLFPLGARVFDKDGGEYTYVKAGASIAKNDAVRFAGSSLGYDDVRPTSAVSQGVLGVATEAFSSGDYGFVQTRGVVPLCKCVNGTAAGALLGSTGTAGTLGLAVNTDLQGRGAVALVTGVAAGSAIVLL
jgi:hypothetical protein